MGKIQSFIKNLSTLLGFFYFVFQPDRGYYQFNSATWCKLTEFGNIAGTFTSHFQVMFSVDNENDNGNNDNDGKMTMVFL